MDEYDYYGDALELMPFQRFMRHPVAFGAGVGVANGLLAWARDKPLTVRGALITALILSAGEAVLALDETEEKRRGRSALEVGMLSGVGVIMGLAAFTNWQAWAGGDRPMLITELVPKEPTDRQAIVPPEPMMVT